MGHIPHQPQFPDEPDFLGLTVEALDVGGRYQREEALRLVVQGALLVTT